ncbi:hypothetical protein T440DRAFT_389569 [Plenodomus tracheiphilus IPT5]|uniref:Xylanolytic transcriptional activator regulatory domain-containing protein n=1 Tax=Plenodomus tracheiphilus IPT5 TaxID=1408161 RepID=A0A6A7BED0_9PLEO|nr:hypothetical protein T440DRAFT_389569 [Plenodomus tracheiphilus IPT5]
MDLNASLVTLLRNLSVRADADDQETIRAALEDAQDDLISNTPAMSVRSQGKRARSASAAEDEPDNEQHGEAFVTASVGSNEHLDFLGENLMRNREAMETGYIGQNSEIQWLRSVQRQSEAGNTDPHGQRYGPPGASRHAANERADALHQRRQQATPGSMGHATDATFYLDSDNIEVDIAVDPFEMPDPDMAERLLDCYVDTVQGTFPLMTENFADQVRRYIMSIKSTQAFPIPDQWLTLSRNLLFAIGAKYSHLINADWQGDERDHLIYMTRAVHLLGLRDTVMIISGPNMNLVQATGALAFYFLVIGHVSRAWVMIGFSIRLALALGLHLRNEDPSLNDAEREPLVRTWWCLHTIECLVSSITGRPPVIASEDCTVPLPKISISKTKDASEGGARRGLRRRMEYKSSSSNASPEEVTSSTTDSRYLLSHIDVANISQKVLLSLYSPRTAAENWVYVQNRVTELLKDLEEWAKVALPSDAAKWDPARPVTQSRDRFLLQISYLSNKILITRPCLCRIERRISGESDSSINFNVRSAETCVEAARELATLFPDQPDPAFIYSQGPWWDVVHIIMQSLAVLLLDMAYRGKKTNGEQHDPHIYCIKKLIRWLCAMEPHDPVANRATRVIWKILKTCAPVLQSQADELLAEFVESHNHHEPRKYTPSDKPYADQRHGLWQMVGDSENGSSAQVPFSNHAAFPLQPTNPMQDPRYTPYLPFTTGHYQAPMTFGYPFTTSFDQGAPVVNMQDLWLDPPFALNEQQPMDFSDFAYTQQDVPQNANVRDYWQPPPEHTVSAAGLSGMMYPPEHQQQRAPE